MTDQNTPLLKQLPQYKDLWNTIWGHRKTVVRIAGAVTVAMLAYVLIMPQSFTSTVTMLPPQEEKSSMGLASLLSGSNLPLMDISSTFGFGSRPSDLYVQVLQSRTVAESLIVTQNLDDFYGIDEGDSYRFAIEPLHESTVFEATKDGLIKVSVTLKTGFFANDAEIDSIKAFAATLANKYVYWMDRVNREKMISRARQSRQFVENELQRTQTELDTAYNQLVAFQSENKSVFLERQMEAALEGATTLKDQIYKAQLELAMKRQDFGESSRIIQQLETEIGQLQELYDQLNVPKEGESQDFYVPFARLPEVAREMAELLRNVKTLEQVILFLNQQYYQDRVQEAKDTPTIQVLDEAVPAIQRTSPKRALWMVLTVLFSTVGAVLFVLIRFRNEEPLPEANDSPSEHQSA
ncbi:MAG: hypothetical protein CL946_13780 [Ectothiorhodospiraceae bacterium]|nr:hypothetical protein [Ectothiorhodospiraceae bacterium]